VLVVDDVITNRQILQVFVKKLGHEVILAEDGQQAVETFGRESPDLVLMDVMMPVMNGYEATRGIKALCGERWVPVVFLSALDKEENLVTGLEVGGDDYLTKPINFVVLQAKLQSLGRAIQTQRQLMLANAELRAYREAQEAENTLANDILLRQLRRSGLDDPAVAHWISPAAAVSGDVVAAARADSGELFVMLADATGHGLAASISTLPLLTLFYEMVDWGMTLSAVVSRINGQLCQALPSSRFVAAALLMIDEKQGTAQAWVGGVPAVLVLGPDGTVTQTLSSNRVSLGIVEFDDEMSAVDSFEWRPGSQFAVCSDGLPEAENATGEAFGLERLRAAMASAPAADRVDAVKAALRQHLGTLSPHDDVTLLLVTPSAR
jgi:DNA-binding response OmpR family regulator